MKVSELTGAALDWAVAKCIYEPDDVVICEGRVSPTTMRQMVLTHQPTGHKVGQSLSGRKSAFGGLLTMSMRTVLSMGTIGMPR
jgi:hypothetical protein